MQRDRPEGQSRAAILRYLLCHNSAYPSCHHMSVCVRIDKHCAFTIFLLLRAYLGLWRKDWVWSHHWKRCRTPVKEAVFPCINCRRGGSFLCGTWQCDFRHWKLCSGPEDSREASAGCSGYQRICQHMPDWLLWRASLHVCVLPRFVQDSGLCLIARAEWHTTLYLRATYLPFVMSLPRMSCTLLFCTYSCLEMNLSHLSQCPLVFCNGPTCRHDMLGGFFLIAAVLTWGSLWTAVTLCIIISSFICAA